MKDNMKPSLYLAGPVIGLTNLQANEWRDYVSGQLQGFIDCYSPLRARKMDFYTGSVPDMPLLTDKGITVRDRSDVMRCSGLLVNVMGANVVSIGTCIELGWADAWRKPIIMVMEKKNIHNHPMVRDLAGYIVHDLDEAIALAKTLFLPNQEEITPFQVKVDLIKESMMPEGNS